MPSSQPEAIRLPVQFVILEKSISSDQGLQTVLTPFSISKDRGVVKPRRRASIVAQLACPLTHPPLPLLFEL
jgi:hypothetical protein